MNKCWSVFKWCWALFKRCCDIGERRRTSCAFAVPVAFSIVLLLSIIPPFAIVGCRFLSPAIEVEVRLPGVPPPWEAEGLETKWTVAYPGLDGEREEKRIREGADSVVIRTARGLEVPVIAFPLGRLKPAGGFVDSGERVHIGGGSFGLENGGSNGSGNAAARLKGMRTLRLSWERGAAAKVLLDLWDEKNRRERVDASALSLEMLMEGEGDPWTCNLERIRSAVLFSSLTSIQISRDELYDVECALPAEDWSYENPLYSGEISLVSVSDDKETAEGSATSGKTYLLRFSALTPGIHRFFSASAGLELHISVQKNGEHRYFYDTPRVFAR